MLWVTWMSVVWQLRPAFAREKTFLWAIVLLASFCVRHDLRGVTSFIRCHWLGGHCYHRLRDQFHSSAIKLKTLRELWMRVIYERFRSNLVQFNGRYVLVADGLKISKEGRKMPAVKSLHQESESNSKAAYIMGHSCQCLALLAKGVGATFAIPLVSQIHEGLVFSNRDNRTLMDKLLIMLDEMNVPFEYYLVADAYYSCGKIALGLKQVHQHLVTRVRSNAVAFEPAEPVKGKRRPGRPRTYGKKVRLRDLFKRKDLFEKVLSPVYGEDKTTVEILVRDLLWRPLGQQVRFVFVMHPHRGRIILMSTDLTINPIDVVAIYGLRFKIEVSFKEAIHRIGAYGYHFWMKGMKKISRGQGDQYLHRESEEYRQAVKTKMHAYEVHIQMGLIAQGLLQYLSAFHSQKVWSSFGSWLRTMKSDSSPSESVTAQALQTQLPQFLHDLDKGHNLKKFLADKLDYSRAPEYKLSG